MLVDSDIEGLIIVGKLVSLKAYQCGTLRQSTVNLQTLLAKIGRTRSKILLLLFVVYIYMAMFDI